MRFFLFFSLLFLEITCCNAQTTLTSNKDENTMLWEVSGKGLKQPSYLFGTFHILCKEDINFSNQLKAAVSNAGELYMELDMDDPALMLGGLSLMSMKGEKKLKDLYTEAEYQKVESFFKDSLHTPLMMLQTMKPYFLVALLYPKMMDCKMTSGIEEQLVQLAKENKKEIKGLETLEMQAAIFDSIPYEMQAKELLKSIDSLAQNKRSLDTMVNVYKSQQVAGIEDIFNRGEYEDMLEYKDVLLDDRNKNWVKQLKAIMLKGSVFAAVGAGHLVGKAGLLELLKQEGYTVRPLLNK